MSTIIANMTGTEIWQNLGGIVELDHWRASLYLVFAIIIKVVFYLTLSTIFIIGVEGNMHSCVNVALITDVCIIRHAALIS